MRFAGYQIRHPLEKDVYIKVQTSDATYVRGVAGPSVGSLDALQCSPPVGLCLRLDEPPQRYTFAPYRCACMCVRVQALRVFFGSALCVRVQALRGFFWGSALCVRVRAPCPWVCCVRVRAHVCRNPTQATEDAINSLRTEFKKIKESFMKAMDAWRAREGDDFGFH